MSFGSFHYKRRRSVTNQVAEIAIAIIAFVTIGIVIALTIGGSW